MKNRCVKCVGTLFFLAAVLVCALGYRVDRLYAQATSGFTKINTAPVTGTTFTTGTLTDGTIYEFEVLSVDLAGRESPASNIATAVIPSTLTHTATLNWKPDAGNVGVITFNVYQRIVTIPNPPGAVSVTVN